MQSRLLQHCKFYDEKDILIVCGIEGIFLYKLTYTGAVDKKQVHKLDPLGQRLNFTLRLLKRLDGVTEWIKGFTIDEEWDLLFAWSLTETSIYKLSDGSHHFSFKDLFVDQESVITSMLYMPKYRYIVVATETGHLVVYKWETTASVITEFKGINRAIRSMARHPNRVN